MRDITPTSLRGEIPLPQLKEHRNFTPSLTRAHTRWLDGESTSFFSLVQKQLTFFVFEIDFRNIYY